MKAKFLLGAALVLLAGPPTRKPRVTLKVTNRVGAAFPPQIVGNCITSHL